MNTEKEKLLDTSKQEKDLLHSENSRVRREVENQLADLKK